MALSLATVGGKITAAFINAVIARVNRQGSTLMIPTSVSGSGVSVSSTGVVTLNAATTATINGIFTSEFENYMVKVRGQLTGAGFATLALALSGTTVSTANYDQNYQSTTGTATSAPAQPLAATSWNVGAGAQVVKSFTIELFSPALTIPTEGTIFGVESAAAGASLATFTSGIFHRLSTAYDGITFGPGGTFSGRIWVYGYNNGV